MCSRKGECVPAWAKPAMMVAADDCRAGGDSQIRMGSDDRSVPHTDAYQLSMPDMLPPISSVKIARIWRYGPGQRAMSRCFINNIGLDDGHSQVARDLIPAIHVVSMTAKISYSFESGKLSPNMGLLWVHDTHAGLVRPGEIHPTTCCKQGSQALVWAPSVIRGRDRMRCFDPSVSATGCNGASAK